MFTLQKIYKYTRTSVGIGTVRMITYGLQTTLKYTTCLPIYKKGWLCRETQGENVCK